jgi:transcriptional regulator with XRE-family HTH domain
MGDKIKISSAQIRAARALLDWSARELSKRSGVSQSTIHRAETTDGNVHGHTLVTIKATFEQFGIEFLSDSGVRLRLLNGHGMQLSHSIL